MDYELPSLPVAERLAALGHDQEWLDQWNARPVLDKEAVMEWIAIHRHSDSRLPVWDRVSSFIRSMNHVHC
jgi:hypothetical protein